MAVKTFNIDIINPLVVYWDQNLADLGGSFDPYSCCNCPRKRTFSRLQESLYVSFRS